MVLYLVCIENFLSNLSYHFRYKIVFCYFSHSYKVVLKGEIPCSHYPHFSTRQVMKDVNYGKDSRLGFDARKEPIHIRIEILSLCLSGLGIKPLEQIIIR